MIHRFLAAAAIIAFVPFAHADAQQRTLLGGDGTIHNGWFVASATKITRVNAENTTLGGLRLGWLVNHNFSIGLAGYGMGSDNTVPTKAREHYTRPDGSLRDLDLLYGYGGFDAEYTYRWDNLVTYSFGALVGAGNMEYADDLEEHEFNHHDSFFVLEPGANVELNVTRWMKTGLGASYRVVTGVNSIGMDNHDASGFSGTITFKFGRF